MTAFCDLCRARVTLRPGWAVSGGVRHKACHLDLPPDPAWANPDHDVRADIIRAFGEQRGYPAVTGLPEP